MMATRLGSLALAFVITGCSDPLSSADPVIQSGYAALDGAYATDVKPSDATFTQCQYALVGARHIARCGISFGGPKLAQLGYWEIERRGDGFTLYAMNGKALAALDKIAHPGSTSNTAHPGAFVSGQGRVPLDVSKAAAAFK